MKTQPKNYQLELVAPDGISQVKADTLDALVMLSPSLVSNELKKIAAEKVSGSLDETAKAVQQAYNQRYVLEKKRLARSRPARAGFELDIIKCYLQGFTATETQQWLKDNRGFTASKSSIGRYWQNLHKLGVIPNPDFCLARI